MKILFVKSNLIGSKLIRWGLNEDCSHTAILFDDKFVIHSSLFGVELNWFNSFKKHYDIVHEIDLFLFTQEEEDLYRGILDKYDDCGYDYWSFLYFCFRGFLYKIFKIPLPDQNPLNKANSLLCTELISILPERVVKIDRDLSITSPHKLYELLGSASKDSV